MPLFIFSTPPPNSWHSHYNWEVWGYQLRAQQTKAFPDAHREHSRVPVWPNSLTWSFARQTQHWWKLVSLKSRYVFLPGEIAATCLRGDKLRYAPYPWPPHRFYGSNLSGRPPRPSLSESKHKNLQRWGSGGTLEGRGQRPLFILDRCRGLQPELPSHPPLLHLSQFSRKQT